MKIGDQKVYRTLKTQTVRGLLHNNRVPGTSVGTRATTAPGLELTGSAARLLEESQVKGSLPCQARFEQHQRDLLA